MKQHLIVALAALVSSAAVAEIKPRSEAPAFESLPTLGVSGEKGKKTGMIYERSVTNSSTKSISIKGAGSAGDLQNDLVLMRLSELYLNEDPAIPQDALGSFGAAGLAAEDPLALFNATGPGFYGVEGIPFEKVSLTMNSEQDLAHFVARKLLTITRGNFDRLTPVEQKLVIVTLWFQADRFFAGSDLPAVPQIPGAYQDRTIENPARDEALREARALISSSFGEGRTSEDLLKLFVALGRANGGPLREFSLISQMGSGIQKWFVENYPLNQKRLRGNAIHERIESGMKMATNPTIADWILLDTFAFQTRPDVFKESTMEDLARYGVSMPVDAPREPNPIPLNLGITDAQILSAISELQANFSLTPETRAQLIPLISNARPVDYRYEFNTLNLEQSFNDKFRADPLDNIRKTRDSLVCSSCFLSKDQYNQLSVVLNKEIRSSTAAANAELARRQEARKPAEPVIGDASEAVVGLFSKGLSFATGIDEETLQGRQKASSGAPQGEQLLEALKSPQYQADAELLLRAIAGKGLI